MAIPIQQAVDEFRRGRFLIVIDEEAEANSGDLLVSAEHADAERINFMMLYARGLPCVAMTRERLGELNLPPMAPESTGTRAAFTVSVDSRQHAGVGDSAASRAATIAALIDPRTRPQDLLRPGHVFPLRAVEGGVLHRVGHTEAAVDLARLAGVYPAGVTCQVLDGRGMPADMTWLRGLSEEHGISIVTIADLISHRRHNEVLVVRRADAHLPTMYGDFTVAVYESLLDGADYLAIYQGDVSACEAPLVRVHSGCVTGDVLGSLKCDCGWQVAAALQRIDAEGCGVLVYVASHEGRGIGLANKIAAYHLQEAGYDTVEANEALGFPADLRDYGIGAQVLADLGVTEMRLMTNNPAKYAAMEGYGLKVVARIPLEAPATEHCFRYLQTKRDKMGHLIDPTLEDIQ
jgi:3,4-dihydroxy 2-butanone 4-phosphate synthase / GTP cyclohydrolase II